MGRFLLGAAEVPPPSLALGTDCVLLSLGDVGPKACKAENSNFLFLRPKATRGRSKRFRVALWCTVLCAVKFVVLLETAFWRGFVHGSAAKYE